MDIMVRKLGDRQSTSGNLQWSVLSQSQIEIHWQQRENAKKYTGLMCFSVVFPKTADQFTGQEKGGRELRWEERKRNQIKSFEK